MKELFSKRKPLVIIAIVLIVILLGFIGFLIYNKFTGVSPKTKAENKISELSDKFYEHYYEQKAETISKEELKTFLSNYKDSGLIINLEDLQIYLDTFNIEDYSAFDKCDKAGTKVIVYPTDPYGKKDYRKSYTLNCKF